MFKHSAGEHEYVGPTGGKKEEAKKTAELEVS
jgi:hypothetical protein